MDAAAWLAEFARRELAWRAERQAFWDRVSTRVPIELSHVVMPVVLTPGEELDAGSDRVPTTARRAVVASVAAGWEARVVASTAAIPTSGLVNVVTVRARRHDERLWAAWRNGGFDVAWYVGPTGLERLGWARIEALMKMALLAADRAAARATVIPYKIGPSGPPKPVEVRGVLDAIEGVRLPKHWISTLERQDMGRAVGVLASAFPGLCLTRQ